MVKLINENIRYYKTKCQHCESYLMFETEDEHCVHENKDKRVWYIKCPKCGKQTPTYEMSNGKSIDYQIIF